MPKAPRDKEKNTTPKSALVAVANGENGVHPETGAALNSKQVVVTSPEHASEVKAAPAVEEKIRARAYELYSQRGSKWWIAGAGLAARRGRNLRSAT